MDKIDVKENKITKKYRLIITADAISPVSGMPGDVLIEFLIKMLPYVIKKSFSSTAGGGVDFKIEQYS